MASFKQLKFYILLLSGLAISVIGIYIFFSSTIAKSLLNLSQLSYTPGLYQQVISVFTKTRPLTLVDTNAVQHQLKVYIADTDQTRQKGLMGITTLAQNTGMLFIFPDNNQVREFWMKDTKIPLDMIFMDANKNVVHIQNNAQPCTADPCPIYTSQFQAQYVIEVPGGWAQTNGIDTTAKAVF